MDTAALHVPGGGWPVPTPGLTTGSADVMRWLGPYSRTGVAVVRVVFVQRIHAEEALVCALVTPWKATAQVAEGAHALTARVVEDRVPELPALVRQGTCPLAQEESGRAGGRVKGEGRSGALRAAFRPGAIPRGAGRVDLATGGAESRPKHEVATSVAARIVGV